MNGTHGATRKQFSWQRLALAAIAGLSPVFVGLSECEAQIATSTSSAQGTIARFTTAPGGERDGAVLDSGTVLHWPPLMQDRFTAILKEGDQVRASGRTETGPAGDTHFEIQSVTDLRSNSTANNPDFNNAAPPPPAPGAQPPAPPAPVAPPPGLAAQPPVAPAPPAPPTNLPAVTRDINGTVQSLDYGPAGNSEGFLVRTDHGDWVQVNFPPGTEGALGDAVKVGDKVSGSGTAAPAVTGRSVVDLISITPPNGRQIRVPQPQDQKQIHLDGVVQRLSYGRAGDVNGVILNTGEFVHLGAAGTTLNPAPGQRFTVDGLSVPTLTGMTVVYPSTVNGTALQVPPPPSTPPLAPPLPPVGGPAAPPPPPAQPANGPGARPVPPAPR